MGDNLDAVLAALARIEAKVDALKAAGGATAGSQPASGGAADDADLDSEWGDPIVKKDPTRWKGASYAGCHMSECPADYLGVLASQFDWMAQKDDEQKKTWTSNKPGAQPVPASSFKRKDAARARGWAARARASAGRGASNGSSTPRGAAPPVADAFDTGADDIPF
jgi:hypothetical protein